MMEGFKKGFGEALGQWCGTAAFFVGAVVVLNACKKKEEPKKEQPKEEDDFLN